MELVAVDIGGTNARFALARIAAGRVETLDVEHNLHTADHASLPLAWQAFAERIGRPLPRAAAIAVAAPIGGTMLQLTNSSWVIDPAALGEELGIAQWRLINDFGAIGHAVGQLGDAHFRHLCGPNAPWPSEGTLTIVGPGTGLGVAQLHRHSGSYRVIETEGGHTDFAPLDALDDALLCHLRARHGRVSVERIVSGPGLTAIHEALAHRAGRAPVRRDDKALWTAALDGSDDLVAAALARFCHSLGAVAGDLALAHGSGGVVIAGGLGQRIADRLAGSGFAAGFTAKGRFAPHMARIPVKLIAHPQPGLYGAAAAFAREHG